MRSRFTIDMKCAFIVLAIFIISIFSVKVIVGGWGIGSDGLGYYAHLRSLMIDGDLHYENEFRDFNRFNHSVLNPNLRTETNYVPNKYPIGSAILWIPFFLFAHLLTYFVNIIGFTVSLDGYSILYQFLIGIGSIVYGFIGLYYTHKIVQIFYKKNISTISIVTIVLATNLLYYFINEPTMPHLNSMFSVSLFVYMWIRDYGKKTSLSYLYLGLISGIMIMTRYQNVLFMVLPFFELICTNFRGGIDRKKISSTLTNGGFYFFIVIITLIPQFIVWRILYGQFLVYPYSGEGFNFFSPKMLETLFSSRHGLISWTPIILLSLIGLYYFTQTHRRVGYLFVICFILQWYINSSWDNWWFGLAYGGRSFINCTFIFVIGLAALITRFYSKRRYIFTLFPILIVWNFLFITQYILNLIPQDDYINWRIMIRNQVNIPYIISRFLDLIKQKAYF